MTQTRPARGFAAESPTTPLASFSFARRVPGPRDVQIEILFCGVCHSDLHQVRDEWAGTTFPIVPGHEILGRVTAVGAEVTRFKRGEIAAVGCMVDSCRTCPECREGLEQLCQNTITFTYNSPDPILGGSTYGGYSDSIVVDQRFALRIPANLDLAGVDMTNATLRGADLQGTDFSGAKLLRADFSRTTVQHANFTGADLTYCDFTGAHGRGTLFLRTRMVNTMLRRVTFKNCVFAYCDMTGSDFLQSDFLGSIFYECKGLDEVVNADTAIFYWYRLPGVNTRPLFEPTPGYVRVERSATGGISFAENVGGEKRKDE